MERKGRVKLKQLYEDGLTLKEIGQQLNRSKDSVEHRIVLLKKSKELIRRTYKKDLNDVYYNFSNNELKKFRDKKSKYGEISTDNYEVIANYDKECEESGLTPTSRTGIIHDLTLFCVFLKDKKLLKIGVEDIKEYISELKKRLMESSIRTHKSRIKGLYKELIKTNSTEQSLRLIYDYLDAKPRGRKEFNGVCEGKERLTRKEIVRLVTAIKGDDKASIRDRAIISSLYDAGARCSEFISIRVKDTKVDDKFPHYYLPISKTKPRDTHILNFSLPYIMKWKNCHEFMDNDEASFFYSLSTKNYGEGLTTRAIQQILKKARGIAGIKKIVSPHILRDSKAVHCAEGQMTSAEANLLFGWGRGSSMFNYYSTISIKALQLKEMERAGKLTEEQIQELKEESNAFVTRNCNRCHTKILPDQFVCPKCGLAKNQKIAEIELKKEKESAEKMDDLKTQMELMQKEIREEFKKDIKQQILRELNIKK